MLRLSDNKDYAAYMQAIASSKFEEARRFLENIFNLPTLEVYQRAFLLQSIGRVHFREGAREKSIEYFLAADSADPFGLSTRYEFAKFLEEPLCEYRRAAEKCEEIVRLAQLRPYAESEEDFGSQEYAIKAEELLRQCRMRETKEGGFNCEVHRF